MHPPEGDELEGNSFKLMTEYEIREIHANSIFDFNQYSMFASRIPKDEAALQRHVQTQSERLATAAQEVREITDKKEYDMHTDLLHDYFRNPDILQNYFICKNKAFLKMGEIFDMILPSFFEYHDKRSFHICEGPGYFIDACYLSWLRLQGQKEESERTSWDWCANTLNPYCENISCFDKLIDDSHIRGHMNHWFFGDSDDGDVKKLTEDYLVRENLAGTFDLVTADGSVNTQGHEGEIEEIVGPLIMAEVEVALRLLRSGGCLVLKMYRLCTKEMQAIMMCLAENFSNIKAFKPMTSRPGSSERYIICEGYGERMEISGQILAICDEFFLRKQLERIDMHVNTFNEKEIKYTWDDRKKFLQTMKTRYFTAENSAYRDEIRRMFPSGPSRYSSPWMELYGHNLIRRYEESSLETAVDNYIDTADVFSPYENNLDIPLMLQYALTQEKLWITSELDLVIEDSLFIEPIAFKSMITVAKNKNNQFYYDFFQNCSFLFDPDEDHWRKKFKKSNGEYTVEMGCSLSIENFLTVVLEGLDSDMTSFTFTTLPEKGPPLWLSRLSASMFCLFFIIFEHMELGNRQVRYNKKRNLPGIRDLVERLRRDLSALPRGNTTLRSFMPLRILDVFHPIICYQNVAHLTHIWRQLE